MTNLNDFTKAFAVDPKTFEDGFKTWASFGEQVSGITLDAAAKSNAIATQSAEETIANLRDVTVVRDDPAAYGLAFADFAQKQVELALRTAQAFGGIVRNAQQSTGELMSKAAEQATGTAAANVNRATRKTASAAKNAA